MNEQSPMNGNEPLSRHEARRQRREARLADPSRTGSWIAGLILIVLGGMFLMQNMGSFDMPLKNWWALFILIPAVGAFDTAMRMDRQDGHLNAAARSSLLVGTVLTFITFMFLFNISWSFFGPVLIILVGIAIIMNYTLEDRE